jgi:hypothetical protein
MLGELAAVEQTMLLAENLLAWAKPRHHELMAALDQLTTPTTPQTPGLNVKSSPVEPPPAPPALPQRRYVSPGYTYKGMRRDVYRAIDIYKAVMRRLLEDHPERRDAILGALDRMGRTRCYLSRDRSRLFSGKDDAWTAAHSEDLDNGWFLDTNLKNDLKRSLLRAAVTAVGLAWGKDVAVRFDGGFVEATPPA